MLSSSFPAARRARRRRCRRCSRVARALGAGRGGAEAVERDRVALVADPALPAQRDAGLDREPRLHVGRQHLLAVLRRLPLEELPARHRDDADGGAVLGRDLPPGLERERDLRAGARSGSGRARRDSQSDVRAALDARRGAELGAVERRHLLPRQRRARPARPRARARPSTRRPSRSRRPGRTNQRFGIARSAA